MRDRRRAATTFVASASVGLSVGERAAVRCMRSNAGDDPWHWTQTSARGIRGGDGETHKGETLSDLQSKDGGREEEEVRLSQCARIVWNRPDQPQVRPEITQNRPPSAEND
jgi:hypothetical protein